MSNQFPYDKELRRMYTMNTFELDRNNRAVGPLYRYKWFRIVMDEAHTVKNRVSRMSVACAYLQADRRWCLTGTPVHPKNIH